MVDLSWGPFDCAFERVGPPQANAGGLRSTTTSLLISIDISGASMRGDGSGLELDAEPGRSVLRAATVPRFFFGGSHSTLSGSPRASAPAPTVTRLDRRFDGAALARRPASSGAFSFVCSGMMGS